MRRSAGALMATAMSCFGGAAWAADAGATTAGAPLPTPGPARVALPSGDYDFATVALNGAGQPVCREHWVLAADGTAVQESGHEIIRSRWSTEGDADGDRLHLSERRGNGKADCTGNISGRQPSPRLIRYMVTNDGGVMICAEPRRMADGALWENCYALLTRRPG